MLFFSIFTWLWMFLTEIVLICGSLFRYCGARGKFFDIKKHSYILLSCLREQGSTQAHHLLVIFDNFENYVVMSKTESSLSISDVFIELPLVSRTCATKWKWGILYNKLLYRQVIGMHSSRNSEDVSRRNSGVLLYFCFT